MLNAEQWMQKYFSLQCADMSDLDFVVALTVLRQNVDGQITDRQNVDFQMSPSNC
jgi:hypothetical protein